MAEVLLSAFDALLKVHGTQWRYGKTSFAAIAQSGAYAAFNFVDGNTAIKILRLRSDALAKLPKKGEVLVSPDGKNARVQRSRSVDGDFSEIEVDEV